MGLRHGIWFANSASEKLALEKLAFWNNTQADAVTHMSHTCGGDLGLAGVSEWSWDIRWELAWVLAANKGQSRGPDGQTIPAIVWWLDMGWGCDMLPVGFPGIPEQAEDTGYLAVCLSVSWQWVQEVEEEGIAGH